jgi:hypothetical protein
MRYLQYVVSIAKKCVIKKIIMIDLRSATAVFAPEKEGLRINYLKALNKENEDYAGNYKEIENNFQG